MKTQITEFSQESEYLRSGLREVKINLALDLPYTLRASFGSNSFMDMLPIRGPRPIIGLRLNNIEFFILPRDLLENRNGASELVSDH